MDKWQKLKALNGFAAAIVIPIVVVVIGNQFASAIKEREAQSKFVELAIEILRESPTPETTALRTWATQIVDEYSGVPLSTDVKRDLIESQQLPQESTTDLTFNSTVAKIQSELVTLGCLEEASEMGYPNISGRWPFGTPDALQRLIRFNGEDPNHYPSVFSRVTPNSSNLQGLLNLIEKAKTAGARCP